METQLEEVRFKDLFEREVLPSGHPFKLMPDTVDTALKVAEVNDGIVWRKKALQAYAVTESVAGMPLRGEDSHGVEFIHGMLDIDVVFLSLAWTAQMNGMSLSLEEGVPCPTCAHPFMAVEFGNLKIYCRPQPMSGPDTTIQVEDVDESKLPKSLQGSSIYITDPTWKVARQNVAENSWSNPEVITMYRAMSALRASPKSGSGAPRALSMNGEAKQIRMQTLNSVIKAMDMFVPHFEQHLELVCENCGETSVVPFDQGL